MDIFNGHGEAKLFKTLHNKIDNLNKTTKSQQETITKQEHIIEEQSKTVGELMTELESVKDLLNKYQKIVAKDHELKYIKMGVDLI